LLWLVAAGRPSETGHSIPSVSADFGRASAAGGDTCVKMYTN
jgi:hypothetical protein